MRCGKSRLLEAIEHVVAKPWKAIQPSEPVLFRFNAAASRRGPLGLTTIVISVIGAIIVVVIANMLTGTRRMGRGPV
jgi:hypothetical protein